MFEALHVKELPQSLAFWHQLLASLCQQKDYTDAIFVRNSKSLLPLKVSRRPYLLRILSSRYRIFWRPYLLETILSEDPVFWDHCPLQILPPDSPISRGSTFWRLHLLGALLLPEGLLPSEGLTSCGSVASSPGTQQGRCSDFHNAALTRSCPYLTSIFSLLPSSLWVLSSPSFH